MYIKEQKKVFPNVSDTFRTFRESDFTGLDVLVFGHFDLIPFQIFHKKLKGVNHDYLQ